jgi:regulator of protease activity HflC (stomatin/prohibitin superfamily)
MREREHSSVPGGPAALAFIAVAVGAVVTIVVLMKGAATAHEEPPMVAVLGLVLLTGAALLALGGLFTVNPNEGVVLQLFGRYIGTVKHEGLRWASPFYSRRRLSLRARSLDSERLKVNDLDGSPIEIASVIVWRVKDTAEACFQVHDYEKFVQVQSEAAVRNLATRYRYDAHEENQLSLRSNTTVIADHLKAEVQERLQQAGVEVAEARISHLAYAPEIAQAMLQRQQAGAIVAARARIVEGAVGMVEMALEKLAREKIVVLDEERKAQMVSNLLVVLCGERASQPVINTGTIYQ